MVAKRDPHQPEFQQAVKEVMLSLWPFIQNNPKYAKEGLLERLVEAERVIQFRVSWVDDRGQVQINRAFRIQHSSSIGPFKGGMRFHPSVNLSILKFLAFEQTLKNSLTTLPMGGAKGGSDFDPHGKSDFEVMRFCQSFMIELSRHIGQFTDVPAGDIGVGGREIGYMFGQYKRLKNEFVGVLTGKGVKWGGSFIRPEATGYGCVYFASEMLAAHSKSLEGKTCLVSGSGNVAQFTVEKLLALGAKPVSLSDSDGSIYDEAGIDREKLDYVLQLKNVRRGRIKEYAQKFTSAVYTARDRSADRDPLWDHKADCAFPSATQNEINGKDAENLVRNGVTLVAEGSNMSTAPEGVEVFQDRGVLYAPGKAANAGGVATSGLEMTQNSLRQSWTRQEVDQQLHRIMKGIHASCLHAAQAYGSPGNYVAGANIAGFLKVADAMLDQGIV
ncbi:MAG: NADP-specific glutamate dehydrogenase [Spirochaetaceae bacterium]|nr:NADP-specific glutamate dehydrogenase [Spirochaetaceae bacterium]